jgi:Zn-dependent protease with chaperone function
MAAAGAGIYFDGRVGARRAVSLELEAANLVVRGNEEEILARWSYGEMTPVAAPAGLLRLARGTQRPFARVEVRDQALAAAIEARRSAAQNPARRRPGTPVVVAASLAAVLALAAGAILGIPAIADRLAPLVPVALERQLGDAVDAKLRALLEPGVAGASLECGTAEAERPGRQALDRLISRLQVAAGLPIPLRVAVVRRGEANALALPGGRIYLYAGLLAVAETPDELAGALAHEIGHVVHRDGMRSLLQASGLSLLLGTLMGDYVGGGAMVMAARGVLTPAYTREAEAAADRYAVDLMARAGGNARALGALLARISGSIEPKAAFVADHPDPLRRAASMAAAPDAAGPALLGAEDWAQLKRICARR